MLTGNEKRIVQIPVIRIRQSSVKLRNDYTQKEIKRLAKSIGMVGMLYPLLVRKVNSTEYEMIDGERRLRAAVMCGIKKLPCIVVSCNDRDAEIKTLAANLTKKEPDRIDISEAQCRIMEKYSLSAAQLSASIGAAHGELLTNMKLQGLSDDEKELAKLYGLTKEHLLAALKISDPIERKFALSKMIEAGMNASQAEYHVEKLLTEKRLRHKSRQKSTLILKNTGILENTINKTIDTIRNSGLTVMTEQKETDTYIEYSIRVEKYPGRQGGEIKTA